MTKDITIDTEEILKFIRYCIGYFCANKFENLDNWKPR